MSSFRHRKGEDQLAGWLSAGRSPRMARSTRLGLMASGAQVGYWGGEPECFTPALDRRNRMALPALLLREGMGTCAKKSTGEPGCKDKRQEGRYDEHISHHVLISLKICSMFFMLREMSASARSLAGLSSPLSITRLKRSTCASRCASPSLVAETLDRYLRCNLIERLCKVCEVVLLPEADIALLVPLANFNSFTPQPVCRACYAV